MQRPRAPYKSCINMTKKYASELLLNALVSVTACKSDARLFQAAGLKQKKPSSPYLGLVLDRTQSVELSLYLL